MSKEWREATLEEACEILDSKRKPIKKSDRKAGVFPYYGASGIADYIDDFAFDGTHLLLSEDGDNLKTQNTPVAFLAKGKFWVNNHAHVLKGKDGNLTEYICYALQVADIKSYISGSTRPKITQGDMRKIRFNLPPLEEQKTIAHILGKLDDKIELNRQMNQTLEQMAQALFQSWFVDFDPVLDNAITQGNEIPEVLHTKAENRRAVLNNPLSGGDKGVGAPLLKTNPELAAQFPSTFTYNETLGKYIPEGWEVKELNDVLSTIIDHRGKTPKKLGGDWVDEGYPAISAKNVKDGKLIRPDMIRFINDELYAKWMKEPVQKGDIIMTSEAPMGEMFFIADDTNYVLSQRLYGMRADGENITPLYLYNWLQTDIAQGDLEGRCTGTTVTGIKQSELRKVLAMCPSIQLQHSFESLVNDFFNRINNSNKQTETLERLREVLLPQLISGKVKVPEALLRVQEVVG